MNVLPILILTATIPCHNHLLCIATLTFCGDYVLHSTNLRLRLSEVVSSD